MVCRRKVSLSLRALRLYHMLLRLQLPLRHEQSKPRLCNCNKGLQHPFKKRFLLGLTKRSLASYLLSAPLCGSDSLAEIMWFFATLSNDTYGDCRRLQSLSPPSHIHDDVRLGIFIRHAVLQRLKFGHIHVLR